MSRSLAVITPRLPEWQGQHTSSYSWALQRQVRNFPTQTPATDSPSLLTLAINSTVTHPALGAARLTSVLVQGAEEGQTQHIGHVWWFSGSKMSWASLKA